MTPRPPESAYHDQEQFDQAQRKHWDKVEAYCPVCEIAYTLTEAEDQDWQCTCGRRIEEN